MDPLWIALTTLAVLSALATAAALFQGLRLRAHVQRGVWLAHGAYLPRVALILPIRGLEEGFDDNMRSLLFQDYPTYRVLVVADDEEDPASSRIRAIAKDYPRVPVSYLLSNPVGLQGKVNALRTGIGGLEAHDEVIVFADADIRPAKDWLRRLVQPLADESVGASTGFRWYVPPRPTFWSLVRSEWNAVSANVLFDPRRNFAWGGSCAIRRAQVESLRLAERWRDVLSDDLILTDAVRKAHMRIEYVPAALVPTFEGCDRAGCLEWCFRQMTMATLYLPIVRRYAIAGFAVFNGSVVVGLISLLLAVVVGNAFLIPAALFLVPLPAAPGKAWLRRRALLSGAPAMAGAYRVAGWRTAVASLAVPWVMVAGLVRTRRPTIVTWRGRSYDVRDPHRVRQVLAGRPR